MAPHLAMSSAHCPPVRGALVPPPDLPRRLAEDFLALGFFDFAAADLLPAPADFFFGPEGVDVALLLRAVFALGLAFRVLAVGVISKVIALRARERTQC